MSGCWSSVERGRNSHVEGTATAAKKTGHEAAEPAKENAEAEGSGSENWQEEMTQHPGRLLIGLVIVGITQ
jgi:hypothetical protein